MLLAMARDVRVILIKLADRLHNMRTLDAMAPVHRRRIARETLDIYAPIANRLGLNALYLELQDLSFKHLHPMRYRILADAIKAARGNRREVMNRLLDVDPRGLREGGHRRRRHRPREDDLLGLQEDAREALHVLAGVRHLRRARAGAPTRRAATRRSGVLHALYKPIPGKFKDYVAIPKANGYQSLHTTLFGPFGTPLEAQIRTHDMHRIAEAGVAAHWLYKTGGELDLARGAARDAPLAAEPARDPVASRATARSSSRTSRATSSPTRSTSSRRRARSWRCRAARPRSTSPTRVHTDIGHHCVAARINYELMPLRTELKNGDHVEILTSPTARPNPSWLSFVATGKARSRIRHFLKGLQQKESAALGERLLDAGAGDAEGRRRSRSRGIAGRRSQKEYGAKSQLDILADIGLGKRLSFVVAQALTRAGGQDRGEPAPAPAQAGRR